MAFKFLDRAQQSVASAPGTGPAVLSGTLAGYQTFSQAGANNNDTFSYLIVDGVNWEFGVVTYTSVGANGTLTRTTITKTSAQNTTPINASSGCTVSAILRGEDISSVGTLQGLADVSVNDATVEDGQVLAWNLSLGRWDADTISVSGTLAGLSDVNVTEGAPIDNYTLNWNNAAGRWEPVAPVSGGGSSTLHGLTDVEVTEGSGIDLHVLQWANSGPYWIAVKYALDHLVDVSVTEGSGIDGYALVWNNTDSKWEAASVGSAFNLAVTNNGTGVESAATTLNFVNATSITTSDHDVTITLPTGGGGGSSLAILNDGTSVDTAATSLNFVNATSITDSSHAITITLPTGGGGGNGLYNQVLSATPTLSGIGFSSPTWINQGSSSLTDSATGVALTVPSNSNNLSGAYITAPSAPYTVTALLGVTRVANGYDAVGIGWYDGSSKLHLMAFESNNGNANELIVEKFNSPTSYDANDYSSGSTNIFSSPIWLRLQDDGSSVHFSFSYDGANFLQVFSTSKSSGWLGSSGYSNLFVFGSCGNLSAILTLMSWSVT
jgi:hypothetical protein